MKPRRSARLQQQDEETLRQIYEACHYRLVLHLSGLLGNRAEALDIAQEALIRLYLAIRRGRKIHSPMYWLLKTANRLALRHLKKMRRRESSTFRPPELISNDLALQEAWSTLKEVWVLLNPSEQLVAKCVLVDQMTLAEIVESTGIPRSTTQRRIAKIQKLIDSAGSKPGLPQKKNGQIGPAMVSKGVEDDEGR